MRVLEKEKFIILEITYSNFKHIPPDTPLRILLANGTNPNVLTLLDGPNGYGKTTLFEAVELLFTGKIKSFKNDLPSRGKETYRLLANDQTKEMVFSCKLRGDGGSTRSIVRIFSSSDDGNGSVLRVDDEPVDQSWLESTFGFNSNLFDLGMYISQKESLSFLQNKYKDRGSELSALLDTRFIQEKLDRLQSIKALFDEHHKAYKTKTGEEEAGLQKQIDSLSEEISQMQDNDVSAPVYERLFPEQAHSFDKETVDIHTPFSAYVGPLDSLLAFLGDYKIYQDTLFNRELDEVLGCDQTIYFALFYRNIIAKVKGNAETLAYLHQAQQMVMAIRERKYPSELSRLSKFSVSEADIEILKALTQRITEGEKQLGKKEKALSSLMESRSRFLSDYEQHHVDAGLDAHHCPLCGSAFDNLLDAFEVAGNELQQDSSILREQVDQERQELNTLFGRILLQLERQLAERNDLLAQEAGVQYELNLETKELAEKLQKVGVSFCSDSDVVVQEQFVTAYNGLRAQLEAKRKPVSKILDDSKIEIYKAQHLTYYKGNPPFHTPEQIQRKRRYLAYQYHQNQQKQVSILKKELEEKRSKSQRTLELYRARADQIDWVISKYKNAQQQYYRSIRNALRLPLYIFSGKIIQNYPLGLGVYAEV